jgi:hypothetical protein
LEQGNKLGIVGGNVLRDMLEGTVEGIEEDRWGIVGGKQEEGIEQ